MPPPDFSVTTRELIAYRSAYICNNPDCTALTIGPATTNAELKHKVGEASHIFGRKAGSARYDHNMTDIDRAAFKNGVWLCTHCHSLADSNSGGDYPAEKLLKWKLEHEKVISCLLLSHSSPLPLLRRHSINFDVAQNIVDLLGTKGAFYEHYSFEDPGHVLLSLKEVRNYCSRESRKIVLDLQLKQIISEISHACREYMNHTSGGFHAPSRIDPYLEILRRTVGVYLNDLITKYGCNVSGPIQKILP